MCTVITDDEARENISANLKRELERQSLSQSELARRCGEHVMTVNTIVNGKHVPGSGLLARLAKALGVTCDSLLAAPRRKNSRLAS